jgi:hypothetical protein
LKIPKYFYKLSLYEQDTFLSLKLQEVHKQEDFIKDMLKAVRGGVKFEERVVDRPDLESMKIDKNE